jgi:cob(I)alamin adenosyltransferase
VSPRRANDEPVRLTSITTGGGDGGDTSLGDGSRVSKLDPLITAIGAVDELNSLIGLARAAGDYALLARIQIELFDIGADLSVPFAEGDGRLRIAPEAIEQLEADCEQLNAQLPELRSFVLPGGSELAARLHVARAVCRRVEREVIAAAATRAVNPLIAVYLNRLSDLLFILSRGANASGSEPLWLPGGSR